jgi:hypothetical protein
MFGLEKFYELFKNSKVLVPALIAIIIIGGLCGTIWISNLNKVIETQKDLAVMKSQVQEDKSKIEVTRLETRLNDFDYEFKRIKNEIMRTSDSISFSLMILKNLANDSRDSNQKKKINSEVARIRTQYDNYSKRIDDLGKEVNFTVDNTLAREPRPANTINSNWTFKILIIACLGILVTALFFIIRRRK